MKSKIQILFSLLLMILYGCQKDSAVDTRQGYIRYLEQRAPEKVAILHEQLAAQSLHSRTALTYIGSLVYNVPLEHNAVFGSIEDPSLWDYYTFYGTAGETIWYSIIPLNNNCPTEKVMDPIGIIFSQVFSDSDELYGAYGGPTEIAFADDDVFTCCYGYPCLSGITLPETGTYTLAMGNWGACGEEADPAYVIQISNTPSTYTCTLSADADGDGIPDNQDAHPNSNLDPTINHNGCNSNVWNLSLGGGTTMMDKIIDCETSSSNHGQFVSCVSALTNEWKNAGLITGAQKGAIMSCL